MATNVMASSMPFAAASVPKAMLADRMKGALYGLLIADALAMPTHWYYGGEQQVKADYGGPIMVSLKDQGRVLILVACCSLAFPRSLAPFPFPPFPRLVPPFILRVCITESRSRQGYAAPPLHLVSFPPCPRVHSALSGSDTAHLTSSPARSWASPTRAAPAAEV
eukprot:199978-Rhodomonas_salina.1